MRHFELDNRRRWIIQILEGWADMQQEGSPTKFYAELVKQVIDWYGDKDIELMHAMETIESVRELVGGK